MIIIINLNFQNNYNRLKSKKKNIRLRPLPKNIMTTSEK